MALAYVWRAPADKPLMLLSRVALRWLSQRSLLRAAGLDAEARKAQSLSSLLMWVVNARFCRRPHRSMVCT